MIDDQELRRRFGQLRAEEGRHVPRFVTAERRKRSVWRPLAAAAVLIILVIVVIGVRMRPTTFSDADRAAARTVAAWRPPTDSLLRTPKNELLTTTPRIPDLKGIAR